MNQTDVGIALMAASFAAAGLAWAWPRLSRRMPALRPRRASPVHAGQRVVRIAPTAPRAPEAPPAATVLADRWALERVIGRGGMGRVWEGRDLKSGRRIAAKTIESPDAETKKILREIYLAEARALSRLRHPNVVDFIEAAPDGDGVALVFAFVSGKTLQQILAEEKRLGWEPARAIFVAVARALAAAHEGGVVHRDLKPANVMVADDGIVKVMDFGVARLLTPDPHAPTSGPAARPKDERRIDSARTSTMVGTPAYMPPEAARGLVTKSGDLFSVGVCLHESLTGELPFGLDGWSAGARRAAVMVRVDGVPPAVDTLLDELLQPDPELRLIDAPELERRLLEL